MNSPAPMSAPMSVRRAGVLLHVTSLPGGRLGPPVVDFLDLLAETSCSVWQLLPLAPTHPGDGSPYNALSAMAGNPDLLDPDPDTDPHADTGPTGAGYGSWRETNADWLEPYVEFTALRALHDDAPWTAWPSGVRDRDPEAVAAALSGHDDELERLRRTQWAFATQWASLRAQAAERGVLLFGDLPIFVSHDSADVWAHRELFLLDAEGRPTTVTGVPPDYFAVDGQRWNNPHYDWDRMAADGYAWWRRRIARQRELFDLVRIDHFRGFEAAWHVPVEAETAREGRWVPGPGAALLQVLVTEAGPGRLVAEDLGVITPPVDALRREFGLPGMKVLQFAFDGDPDNPHLPARHEEQSVVYTGTHDNDTTVGWWAGLDRAARARVAEHLVDAGEAMPWALIRLAMASRARLAVVPAQDLLGLDSRARMNTPGTDQGNWSWQAAREALAPGTPLADRLGGLVSGYDRAR